MSDSASVQRGILAAFSAYLMWGLVPVYFKAVSAASAAEIMAHRVLWSVPVALLLIWLLRQPLQLALIFRDRKLLGRLIMSALAVSMNWFIFTWAVTQGRILDTSLGYFINPLLTILLGVVVLSEKLSRFKLAALLLAAAGVLWQIVVRGELPWISLSLAVTFSLYGLIRKQTPVNSLNGLLVETLLLSPIALIYLIPHLQAGDLAFLHQSWQLDLLLMAAGIVTTVPLSLFAAGARRITLTTLGFLQYTSPSCTLLLAIWVYDEPFDSQRLISFICIWAGLLLLGVEALRNSRTGKAGDA